MRQSGRMASASSTERMKGISTARTSLVFGVLVPRGSRRSNCTFTREILFPRQPWLLTRRNFASC